MENGFSLKKLILIGTTLVFPSLVCAQNVTSVNFIKEGDVSKLIIDFDKEVFAERKHINTDKQILLDIKNAKAEKKFLRGIDTSEFSGAVVYVSPYKKPGTENDLRFAIQLRDNVRSILETRGKRLILNIESRFGVFSQTKLKKAESEGLENIADTQSDQKINIPKSGSIEDILENLTMAGLKKYIGKKISINVNNVSYRELLRMIADTSGFNVIIDEAVNGRPPLTISLTNVPWDQALDTILSLGNLTAMKQSNILIVKTEEKAREEREAELAAKNKVVAQEPLVTKIFPLSFAKMESMQEILADYITKDRGSIKTDLRTNSLIVKDTVENIEKMKKIIEILDTQTPQVLIEAKIVEANEDYEFRAGLGTGGLQFGYDPFTPSGSLGDNSGSFSFSSSTNPQSPGALGASIAVFSRLTNLSFNLELMESESRGKIISAPKIITENKQAATITSTDQTSYRVVQQNQTGTIEGFETVSADLNLTVTPQVTNEGSIAMQVNITKSSFGQQVQDGPPNQTTRNITTNVLVDNGSTVVIGGLYTTETNEVESGIPFLKDLPLVGWLFRSAYNPSNSRSELIIFLTPRIINQEEAGLVSRDMNTASAM